MKAKTGNSTVRGFTMVEIMVAVAILVILASVLLVVVKGVDAKAKCTRVQAQMKVLGDAVEAFKQATGKYPLAVPYDAWNNWTDFVDEMGWDNRPNWTDYFVEKSNKPEFTDWTEYPTNIQMLTFQLEQVPESNSVLNRIKENSGTRDQVKMIPDTLATPPVEQWQPAGESCKLVHPLDNQARTTFQPLDPWGTPLRYWSGDILKWAKTAKANWDASVKQLLSEKLQKANWGFYLESAGPDGLFGWYGQTGVIVTDQQTEDNEYSCK